MISDRPLNTYRIILASGSPRRQELLRQMSIDFDIEVREVDESYPEHLKHHEISDYIAMQKAQAFVGHLDENDLLITSDTIVWHNDRALGKPVDAKDAESMLTELSANTHSVITSVCFTTARSQHTFYDETRVVFKPLSPSEINYYIETCKPFDKAGAYGIQDWIGMVGVSRIEGSYFNVMGFPTQLVYQELKTLPKHF